MKNPSKLKLVVLSMALSAGVIALTVESSFATTPAALQDGAALYAAKCSKCHNADGKGNEKYKKQGIEDMSNAAWQKNHSDAKITAAINNGKGDFMPAWKGKLKPAEIAAVVKHIRSLKK